MKKVLLFARVSTGLQDTESQVSSLKEYAKLLGFKDEDIDILTKQESAVIEKSDNKREYIEELKKKVEGGNIGTILVTELTRLGRVQIELLENIQYLKSNKIQLYIKQQGLQLFDESGNENPAFALLVSILSVMAEQEGKIRKERTERGRKQKISEGKFYGGTLPFGYKTTEDGTIVIDKHNSTIVQKIYELYADGTSLIDISDYIFEKYGITMKGSRISGILGMKSYTGDKHTTYKKKLIRTNQEWGGVERVLPQIIDIDLYNKVKLIKSERVVKKAGNIYYAKKLCKCISCGGGFTANNVSYGCLSAFQTKRVFEKFRGDKIKCTHSATININILDGLISGIASEIELTLTLEERAETLNKKEELLQEKRVVIENYKKRIEDLEVKIEEIYNGDYDIRLEQKHIKKHREQQEYCKDRIFDEEKQIILLKKEIENIKKVTSDEEKVLLDNLREVISKGKLDYINSLKDKRKVEKYYQGLVHKHIQRITIEEVEFVRPYVKDWNKIKGETPTIVKAKRIIINTHYYSKPLVYIYIPNIRINKEWNIVYKETEQKITTVRKFQVINSTSPIEEIQKGKSCWSIIEHNNKTYEGFIFYVWKRYTEKKYTGKNKKNPKN